MIVRKYSEKYRQFTQREKVCMNPFGECECCVFQTSRWCLAKERQAKAAVDRVEMKRAAAAA